MVLVAFAAPLLGTVDPSLFDAGSRDPRVYYFRGLDYLKLGREPEAPEPASPGPKGAGPASIKPGEPGYARPEGVLPWVEARDSSMTPGHRDVVPEVTVSATGPETSSGMRPAEVELLLGDPTKAKTKLGWEPKVGFRELVEMMVDADLERHSR